MKPVLFALRGLQRRPVGRDASARASRRRARINTGLACLALASSTAFAAAANPDATPSEAPEADLNIKATGRPVDRLLESPSRCSATWAACARGSASTA